MMTTDDKQQTTDTTGALPFLLVDHDCLSPRCCHAYVAVCPQLSHKNLAGCVGKRARLDTARHCLVPVFYYLPCMHAYLDCPVLLLLLPLR